MHVTSQMKFKQIHPFLVQLIQQKMRNMKQGTRSSAQPYHSAASTDKYVFETGAIYQPLAIQRCAAVTELKRWKFTSLFFLNKAWWKQ